MRIQKIITILIFFVAVTYVPISLSMKSSKQKKWPLHYAVIQKKHAEVIAHFTGCPNSKPLCFNIDNFKKVMVQDDLGMLPLHYAVQSDENESIVKHLLLYGEWNSVIKQDISGSNAFHIAAQFGSLKCMQLLLEQSFKLSFAILLDIAINTKNKDGHTPLFIANKANHQEIVNLLVSKAAHFGGLAF